MAMLRHQIRDRELIIDNFAGGGGASLGIEQALGRPVDIAINHDAEAVATHTANHPDSKHYCEDVWQINPRNACKGRPVGLAWFSPDCKHHSKAKGGKPVSKKIRGLAWVVIKWAKQARPRIIMLENVEEFADWGPLNIAVDAKTGRAIYEPDGTPKLFPCPLRKGQTFQYWKSQLERQGYIVDWKILRASDHGAPTIRKRLFLIARCDGRPIVWPRPTHGDPKSDAVKQGKLLPWRTAAECIDWTLPTPSIFLSKEEGKKANVRRPLAQNTMKRIAKGIKRFVIDAAEPFIVTCNHSGESFRGQGLTKPMNTVVGSRDAHGLIIPSITECANASSQRNMPADEPLRTICAQTKGGHFALVSAFLAKHYGGNYDGAGHGLNEQTGTITAKDHHSLITSHMVKLRGTCKDGQPIDEPAPTITAGGNHIGEVRAFLIKYYGTGGQDQSCQDPVHTIPSRERFGLITVSGQDYIIADIGMRMLTPRELYRAQSFPDSYIIDPQINGKKLSKAAQVRMVGNSVVPCLAKALVEANVQFDRKRHVA